MQRDCQRLAVLALLVAMAALLPATLQGQGAGQRSSQAIGRQTPLAADAKQAGPAQELKEHTSITHHTIRIGGQPVAYTATAGTLILRDDNARPLASFFYVYYTRDNVADLSKRPMIYSFNGGPGTASVWMHMGFTGPRRVVYDDDGFMLQPPFRLADNEQSILDIADIVYIDPVGTGYSRMAPGEDPHKFHGLMDDVMSVGDFIRVFTVRYNRWKSPKFVIGESYGTTRASGLASYLQTQHQLYLNGVILVSMTSLGLQAGDDMGFVTRLPHMTATAWYHKKLPADLQQKSIKQVVDDARTFAFGDYVQALTKGNTLTDAERSAMADRLARYTGLPAKFILSANLRVDSGRFRKELLRDRRLMIGRLDGRFTALDADAAGERQEFDPSNAALQGAYVALFQDYVKNDLKWESDLHYPTSGNVRPWTYVQNSYSDRTDALRQTMAKNPFLKVFVACGYYDMATYVGGAEFNFSHLAYDRQITDRVSFGYYEAGHMMYIRPSAHKALKQDVAKFIRSASAPARTN